MSLAERLRQQTSPAPWPGTPTAAGESQVFQDLKGELHRRLVNKLDLDALEQLAPDELVAELRAILADVVSGMDVPLNAAERERMIQELVHEVMGLGPLEPLIHDATISDILVNTFNAVFVERQGRLEPTGVRFRDNRHLLHIINRIVAGVGRRIDEASPMVDARLPDGSRVNAIIPPLAVDGPLLSIRRFGAQPLRVRDLLTKGSLTREVAAFLAACVRARVSVLIAGGTGSGKTTMLNALSCFIPAEERIVTIEDSAELQLQQNHVARLETRPPNIEGRGEVVARDLVRNSLRMRPDRIILGEVRGAEAFDMLQAMNTGHEGSLATLHANSPRDAVARLESMVGMAGMPMTLGSLRQMIARAVTLIVQVHRGVDGRRRVASVTEITGTEGDVITMQELARFQQRGVDPDGQVLGDFVVNEIRPKVAERIERFGVDGEELLRAALGEPAAPGSDRPAGRPAGRPADRHA